MSSSSSATVSRSRQPKRRIEDDASSDQEVEIDEPLLLLRNKRLKINKQIRRLEICAALDEFWKTNEICDVCMGSLTDIASPDGMIHFGDGFCECLCRCSEYSKVCREKCRITEPELWKIYEKPCVFKK